MAGYAYAIQIDYKKQKITNTRAHRLSSNTTNIDKLKKLTGDNDFYFDTDEVFGENGMLLYVIEKRLETDAEQADRIAKEEAYMVEYNKRKALGGE
ncbi:MAG TPA: hypothetical protein PKI14_04355 [Fervidobacterium sp.]|nr:hypothetical protein [Fervidobacterium sp.]